MTDTKTKDEGMPQSILIVDDDKFLLDMYALKFREKDIDVHTATGSLDALNKINEGGVYDVILLDIVMPSMDGFELLAEIKSKGLAKGSTIIILSNLGQPTDIKKGTELGSDGYIVKANSTPSEVVQQVIKITSEKK